MASKQSSSPYKGVVSQQAIAGAALACLAPGLEITPPFSPDLPPLAISPTSPIPARHHAVSDKQQPGEAGTPLTHLPSLLQYVDNILMRGKERHNKPPSSVQTCVGCSTLWDNTSIVSTFLPLSPCDHWIHYRCLIWLATRDSDHRNECPVCKTQLFEWDGMNALTLAARTNVPMDNKQHLSHSRTKAALNTHEADYEQDCQFINDTISRRFFTQLNEQSCFPDGSPDLVQCFNGITVDLKLMNRPKSRWLTWTTTTGSLLFGMLVAIKMRRFLVESHGRIQQTAAWLAWEECYQAMQLRILEDVRSQ